MKTLRHAFTSIATAAGILLLASGRCRAQSDPNWTDDELAEVTFDAGQRMMQIQTPSDTQQFLFNENGSFARAQDLTSGQNVAFVRDPFGQPAAFQMWSAQTPSQPPVVVPMSPSDNFQDLLDKWDTAGSGITLGGDVLSLAAKAVVWDRFDTHLNAVMNQGSNAISGTFKDLTNAVRNESGIERAFNAAGLGLAFGQDVGNILQNKDADWKTNTVYGKSSENLAGKLLSAGAEKLVQWNTDALAANKGLGGMGLFDDVLKLEPHGFGYAADIRGSIAGQLVGIGFDWLRGKRLDSIDQIQHYLDLGLTGIWSAIPITRPLAPYVADFADFLSAAIRPAAEAWGKAAGESDSGSVATQLYNLGLMTLYGVDSRKPFAQADIDALNKVPGIGSNADYQALVAAFQSGDKTSAAEALKKLAPLLMKGGLDAATITAMEDALTGSSSSSPQDAWKKQEAQLGGVSLEAHPQINANLGAILAVTYDKASGQVVLVTDSTRVNLGVRPQDLATAFAAMVIGRKEGNTRSVAFPQFSLDPAEPTQPDGPWYKAVYIPDFLNGTEIGTAMAVADFRLKQLSFGLGVDYLGRIMGRDAASLPGHGLMALSDRSHVCFTLHRLEPAFPGFTTIPEIFKAIPSQGGRRSRNRLWIVVDRPVRISVAGGSFVFNEPIHMGVCARTQGIGKDGTLQDVDDPRSQDPAAQEFAKMMTANYDRIAAVEPSFALLKERMVPAVAVVEFIRSNGGTAENLDLDWVYPFLAKQNRETSMVGVTRIGFTETNEVVKRVPVKNGVEVVTQKSTYSIFGGCDLALQPQVDPKSTQRAEILSASVRKAMARKPDVAVFPVSYEGKQCTGTILPMGAEGRKRWGNGRSVAMKNGVTYQMDGVGASRHVTSARDEKSGIVRHYEWDSAGLAAVRAESKDGWVATGRRPDASGRIAMSFKSPHGDTIDLNWSKDLQKCEGFRNGKPFIQVEELPAGRGKLSGRISRCTYFPSGAVETIHREANGTIRYVRNYPRNGKVLTEEIVLKRGSDGRPESIATANGRTLRLKRNGKGQVESLDGGDARVRIEYGDANFPELPTAVKGKDFSATLSYDHGLAKTLDLTRGGQSAHAEFDAGRLMKVTGGDFSAALEYFNNGCLKRASNSRGAETIFLPDGRIERSVMADGTRMVPNYEEVAGVPVLRSLKFFKAGR